MGEKITQKMRDKTNSMIGKIMNFMAKEIDIFNIDTEDDELKLAMEMLNDSISMAQESFDILDREDLMIERTDKRVCEMYTTINNLVTLVKKQDEKIDLLTIEIGKISKGK